MKKSIKTVISVILCLCMVFGFSVASSAETADYKRIVSVFNDDPKTMIGISWYTQSDSPSEVKIYSSGKDVTSQVTLDKAAVTSFEGNYVHKVTVKGLTPGTKYDYKVGDGATWSDYYTFTTDDGDSSVDYISVGDPQASDLGGFQKAAHTVEKAFEYFPQADFYTLNGDFTNDNTNDQWSEYFEAFAPINSKTTLVPVTGNHDDPSNWFVNQFNLDTSESVETKDGVNYSFDYGNVHIAIVNTNDAFSMSQYQLNWLKNDLNSTNADWKIVQMHKSPYTLGKDGKWPDALYLEKTLAKVCDECDVDLVISGHDHMYLRTKPLTDNKVSDDGVTYVLGGTCGSKRYEIRTFSVDTFMQKEFIASNIIQKTGYGNEWNGENWDTKDTTKNVGGCFLTIHVDGGNLTLNAYIVSDETDEVNLVDTYTMTKTTGLNTATYTGENVHKKGYLYNWIVSFVGWIAYAVTEWLPKFFKVIPDIIKSYAKTGTF